MQNAQQLDLAIRKLASSQSQQQQDQHNNGGLNQASQTKRRPSANLGLSGSKRGILTRNGTDPEILPSIPVTPDFSVPHSRDEPMTSEHYQLNDMTSSSATIEANLTTGRIGIQSRPESFPTSFHEIVFALICSLGQLFFAW